jgi:hypothetical protein
MLLPASSRGRSFLHAHFPELVELTAAGLFRGSQVLAGTRSAVTTGGVPCFCCPAVQYPQSVWRPLLLTHVHASRAACAFPREPGTAEGKPLNPPTIDAAPKRGTKPIKRIFAYARIHSQKAKGWHP